jgi:hypothetical protein
MALEAVPVMKKDRAPRKKGTRAKALVPLILCQLTHHPGEMLNPQWAPLVGRWNGYA